LDSWAIPIRALDARIKMSGYGINAARDAMVHDLTTLFRFDGLSESGLLLRFNGDSRRDVGSDSSLEVKQVRGVSQPITKFPVAVFVLGFDGPEK
jgi:hypothetical protein